MKKQTLTKKYFSTDHHGRSVMTKDELVNKLKQIRQTTNHYGNIPDWALSQTIHEILDLLIEYHGKGE